MVEKDGEKKTRSSKSRRPRLPKSYRLQKRVPEPSSSKPSSKFKKFNCGSINCTTEKLSSLLMCQKGYASFAFYAVFIVFILAFIYVLWKIVSANTSRSGQSRRPEASSKVSPTTTAPTWSEEDEEELKKFFPTTASFVPTNIGTGEKIDPTSSPLNSPGPRIPLRESISPTREMTRPTQSQISRIGTYLPSLPRLLRGSVFGEDAVTPLYGKGRQNAVIGEDFTPFPATYSFTSRWPSLASTTWKSKQQEQQQPWQFNRQQQMPVEYQRRNPLQSLIRNGELSDQFYGDRGRYSKGKEQSMESSFDTTKRMPTLRRDEEEVKSAWTKEDQHLHIAKKHEDEQKRRHHRSRARKHQHHHKHGSSNEESWIDAENEVTILNDDQDETNSHEQGTLSKKNHHSKHVGARRGEDISINENDLRDAKSYHGHDGNTMLMHPHHHHRGSPERHQNHREYDRSQPSEQQREDENDDNRNNYHHHHHPHTHHQLDSQQQNQDDDQEEKEEQRVHHHRSHHHHYHHARTQQHSKKHFRLKNDLNKGDSKTYREHKHKRVHHHSVLKSEHTKKTKVIHQLKRHHLHYRHHQHRRHFHRHPPPPPPPPPHHHHQQHHHQHRHKHQQQQQQHHHQLQNQHHHFHTTKNHKLDSTHQSSKHTPATNPSLKHFHHILDYKHYLRFKQSHTLEDEVHGNWKNIKRKAKNCINIRTFSANGKVRLARTRYRAKYLYTVLVCKVVRVRKRGGRHKSEYKTAQLCHKLYFITKGVVRLILEKPSKGQSSSSKYEVEACKPSKDVHFQAMSFQGAFSHDDRSQRSDIPKHLHETIKVLPHKKSKKGKLPHKHKGHKHSKHHRTIKHENKDSKQHNHKRAKHIKKHKKEKLNTEKRVSQKQSNKSKKETKDKTQEDVFFGKLLNILTIASGNNKASNSSNNPLMKLKGALQKMKKVKEERAKQLKKKHKIHSKGKKKHLEETKLPDVLSPKYIQKLLEKILPSVVSNVKADLQGGKGEVLVKNADVSRTTTVKPTTTPLSTTKPTTKPTTTTTATTTTTTTTTTATTTATTTSTTTATTTKPTTKPTTKSNGLEDELKSILPLLLKKAQIAMKMTTTQKPTTLPTTKPTLSKTKQIKDLLARLKLGGIDLGGLVDSKPTREVKATANVVHTTMQQRLNELAGLPDAQPRTLQNDMGLSQISNNGGPVSVLGNDPFAKNILCFGDSLTKGYYHHGRSNHPYSIQLARLLNADSQTRYNLVTSGKNGEMTHGSMIKRLPEVLGNSSHFDWVIILAGTNDVAHVKNFGDDDSFMNQLVNVWSPKIFQDIISLHESAYKYGSRTVLLTIPESAYEAWPQFRTLWVMRKKINQELREYASRSQGRTILCDLAMKLPRHSLSPQMQKALWSDHLHFTPYGYDKMAGIIYQCMKPYL